MTDSTTVSIFYPVKVAGEWTTMDLGRVTVRTRDVAALVNLIRSQPAPGVVRVERAFRTAKGAVSLHLSPAIAGEACRWLHFTLGMMQHHTGELEWSMAIVYAGTGKVSRFVEVDKMEASW